MCVWNGGYVHRNHPVLAIWKLFVSTRDADILLPIIQAHTGPSTIIHSDQWCPYRDSGKLLELGENEVKPDEGL